MAGLVCGAVVASEDAPVRSCESPKVFGLVEDVEMDVGSHAQSLPIETYPMSGSGANWIF
jgi:hypothetical protein